MEQSVSSNVRSLTDRTRRPTGRVSHPIVLIEGGELCGKTFSAALLTASPRVGRSWMIQLAESDGDPYGAIVDSEKRPVRYKLVEHDGTWPDIMTAVEQVVEAAIADREAGEPPCVLIFDSMSKEWEMLSTWAENRARKSEKNKANLAKDPNADIEVGHLYWNASKRRHARLMSLFRRFPGIVVLTARGREVSKIGPAGKPVVGQKEYTLESEKGLGFLSTAWVRVSRDQAPTVIGVRMAAGSIQAGIDRPMVVDGRVDDRFKDIRFSLDWLVFDFMGYDPDLAGDRQLNEPMPGADPDGHDEAEAAGISPRCADLRAAIRKTTSTPDLTAVWADVTDAVNQQQITVAEGNLLRDESRAQAAAFAGQQTEAVAA